MITEAVSNKTDPSLVQVAKGASRRASQVSDYTFSSVTARTSQLGVWISSMLGTGDSAPDAEGDSEDDGSDDETESDEPKSAAGNPITHGAVGPPARTFQPVWPKSALR
eukprot:gnl/TRDRNA2_/TRDRNA2_158376_c0_seq1.p1 gnl/TRDRNA2_/TRDRNA2_158376_c0~~gnl/TRDRNA2_/TRDRNA2_158376_c0_seq1.p1  ORF type:complete len:109 (-),score=17.41 gnl/TRDRNA2_/TRDRNA2_158376_c0_seq1:64-390(-)